MSALTAMPARRLATLALAALAALALAACGGTDTPTADAPTAQGTTVAVSGVEYGFVMPNPPTTAGTYTFVFTNDGNMEHDLVIEGVAGASTPVIGPGETAQFTVTLDAGEFTIYCSVSNHRAQGMEATFTVS